MVPVDIPDTIPDVPIAATDGTVELHVPPGVPSVRGMVDPIHTSELPPIAGGAELIVKAFVIKHPVGSVYVIVALPGITPVTMPEVPIVAMVAGAQVQVPPVVISVNGDVSPAHKLDTPLTGCGTGFTVTG